MNDDSTYKFKTGDELLDASVEVGKVMNGLHIAEVITILGILVGRALDKWPERDRKRIFDTGFRAHVFNEDMPSGWGKLNKRDLN